MSPLSEGIKAVLYDCDGLLINSIPYGQATVVRVCREFGIPLEEGGEKKFVGITCEKWYRELLKDRDLDLNVVLQRHAELYDAHLLDVEAFPGARRLPRKHQAEGMALALVSGSTRAEIDLILKLLCLQDIFETTVVYEDVDSRSKPDPYGYQLALERLNASRELPILPSEALVFEDARSGVRAALAAGMRVVGVQHNSTEDLSEAHFVVPDLFCYEAVQNFIY